MGVLIGLRRPLRRNSNATLSDAALSTDPSPNDKTRKTTHRSSAA